MVLFSPGRLLNTLGRTSWFRVRGGRVCKSTLRIAKKLNGGDVNPRGQPGELV